MAHNAKDFFLRVSKKNSGQDTQRGSSNISSDTSREFAPRSSKLQSSSRRVYAAVDEGAKTGIYHQDVPQWDANWSGFLPKFPRPAREGQTSSLGTRGDMQ